MYIYMCIYVYTYICKQTKQTRLIYKKHKNYVFYYNLPTPTHPSQLKPKSHCYSSHYGILKICKNHMSW